MSEQDNGPMPTLQRPSLHDRAIQKIYWEEQGQPWRTEPEISAERQKYLEERRHGRVKERKYIFPLQDTPLSRADIEWLLATHENGRGPLDWNDLAQRKRQRLNLHGLDLRGLDLSELPLANANLFDAHLEGANLDRAHLENAVLMQARLEGASLVGAHLEGAKLMEAHLQGANLSLSYLDAETDLHSVTLFSRKIGGAILGDMRWGDVNLAVVDWSTLPILGNESVALRLNDGKPESKVFLLEFLQRATRAYRQLAVVLRNQGLNEEAARFAYRAQRMQRKVLWYQNKFGQYFLSLFMDLLAGYGYKPWRSFLAYLIVIAAFAVTYFLIGRMVGPTLSPLGAWVFSMTSFHGRGFFPGGIGLDDPLTVVAALEAFVGLLIEVTFIATLTQRLFGK